MFNAWLRVKADFWLRVQGLVLGVWDTGCGVEGPEKGREKELKHRLLVVNPD